VPGVRQHRRALRRCACCWLKMKMHTRGAALAKLLAPCRGAEGDRRRQPPPKPARPPLRRGGRAGARMSCSANISMPDYWMGYTSAWPESAAGSPQQAFGRFRLPAHRANRRVGPCRRCRAPRFRAGFAVHLAKAHRATAVDRRAWLGTLLLDRRVSPLANRVFGSARRCCGSPSFSQ